MAIKIGDQIPEIILNNQYGKEVNVNRLIETSNLVLFFYPKDNTPGCVKEVCAFRDHFDQFNTINTVIIGVSGDSVASHAIFSDRHQLSFSILSDVKNKIRKLMGVPRNLLVIPGRVTYIIAKGGLVVDIVNTLTNPEVHIQTALKRLQ